MDTGEQQQRWRAAKRHAWQARCARARAARAAWKGDLDAAARFTQDACRHEQIARRLRERCSEGGSDRHGDGVIGGTDRSPAQSAGADAPPDTGTGDAERQGAARSEGGGVSEGKPDWAVTFGVEFVLSADTAAEAAAVATRILTDVTVRGATLDEAVRQRDPDGARRVRLRLRRLGEMGETPPPEGR